MKRHVMIACFLLCWLALAGCTTGAEPEPAVETAAASAPEETAPPMPQAEGVEEAGRPAMEETAVSDTAVSPTAVPTPMPPPTEAPVPTASAPLPEPPVRETVDDVTAVTGEAIAYVQDEQIFIRSLPDGDPVPVQNEPCPEGSYCVLAYLKWSPDGQWLLYYHYDGMNSSLRVSDRQGNVQIIEDAAFVRPGDWSPDGQTIVYMQETETYLEADDITPGGRLMEVWTAALAEDGALQTPQLVGSWRQIGDGCGGGGRSPSEVLYENEGGTSYGYRMGVTEWAAQDVLLFNLICTNIGMGRFDMQSGSELPGFDLPLRNLVLNAAGDRWYAVSGNAWDRENEENNQLVTGTPDATEITVIPTRAKVELVFVGPVSGSLYYTERNPLTREDVAERGLYFGFYESALWRMQPDGSGEERLLEGADDHAYAQVTETAVGDLLFVLVENDRPLLAAAQDDRIDDAALEAFMPQRHIMQLPAAGGEPQPVLSNAGQPALLP